MKINGQTKMVTIKQDKTKQKNNIGIMLFQLTQANNNHEHQIEKK